MNNSEGIGALAWILLLVLTVQSCEGEQHMKRIADTLAQQCSKPEDRHD